MGSTADRRIIGAYINRDVADRFEAFARLTDGSVSAAIRRMVNDAVGAPHDTLSMLGSGKQVGVRFREAERQALNEAARARATTPANWVRSLVLAHLTRRPQWNGAEVEALRELTRQVRAIGNHLNQIARALNTAVHSGVYPPHQGGAAREGAKLVRQELRQLTAIITGNYDYWGLSKAEQPSTLMGEDSFGSEVRQTKVQRQPRVRKRPARFAEG